MAVKRGFSSGFVDCVQRNTMKKIKAQHSIIDEMIFLLFTANVFEKWPFKTKITCSSEQCQIDVAPTQNNYLYCFKFFIKRSSRGTEASTKNCFPVIISNSFM